MTIKRVIVKTACREALRYCLRLRQKKNTTHILDVLAIDNLYVACKGMSDVVNGPNKSLLQQSFVNTVPHIIYDMNGFMFCE